MKFRNQGEQAKCSTTLVWAAALVLGLTALGDAGAGSRWDDARGAEYDRSYRLPQPAGNPWALPAPRANRRDEASRRTWGDPADRACRCDAERPGRSYRYNRRQARSRAWDEGGRGAYDAADRYGHAYPGMYGHPLYGAGLWGAPGLLGYPGAGLYPGLAGYPLHGLGVHPLLGGYPAYGLGAYPGLLGYPGYGLGGYPGLGGMNWPFGGW